MKNLFYLFSCLLIFSPILFFSQIENTIDVKAAIEVKNAESMISIHAKAINNDDIVHALNYLLISIKRSSNGNISNNKQEGRFIISPDERKDLSQITINYANDDQVKIYLFIRNEKENQLVSKDSLFFNVKSDELLSHKYNFSNEKDEIVKEEDFELKGLVVDNTKSKIGKDFFEAFYNIYKDSTNQFAFVININELPSIGRNGIINIDTSDKNIYSFRVVPNDDYIIAQAQMTMRYLNNYYRESKLLDKELRAP
ncbi:CsgE family curli-type amyloid fiber assembly protein [Soonwooa purpurea]